MNFRRFLGILFAVVVVFGLTRSLFGWGFWAHKEINRAAIDALPETLRAFFRAHADSIIENSIRPDLRRNSVEREQYYHYIDIDRYGKYPFPELPHDITMAMEKFGAEGAVGADSVLKNGIVPWRIAELVDSLTDAMREERVEEAVFYAADLGHYVADIHMPLHTTENYDGQLTGHKGVHWRFETGITERYGKEYDLHADGAAYVENPLEYAFDAVLESYQFVDSVLYADGKAREGIPESELYTVVTRNGKKEYQYSVEYYDRFNGYLNGLAERRMRAAVRRVASLWYTAWVKAGEPNLPIE